MRIAIIDDLEADRDLLIDNLAQYASMNRMTFSIDEFSCAEDFLRDYQPFLYNIIFMDIYMDGMNGMEASGIIRSKDKYATIVFLTSSDEYMPEAFHIHAYDYLKKPVETSRIYQLMDELLEHSTSLSDAPSFSFRSEKTDITLTYDQIVLVKTSLSNYLEITDIDGNSYQTRMTFSTVQNQLSGDARFLLVIRGILVNMDHIVDIRNKACTMSGNICVPINVRKASDIESVWTNYKFKKMRLELKKRRTNL
ncbi:LytR/AlgR family response regulator transcription factor [Oribacterium sp. WCC10]|uniref:LytR/AlgR family response regulator transcription factor n=1 Tax=Oribacterium sp. WCC10 TaxID=1855343 RepID=UPI0008E95FFF|nr:LytTR family DNA-binding domain-containing protein [Oribacterium sp. WCC10]SFG26296.1 DNA-binding response regulator, LytR/AlgR family [Oribacterium sp. WCC10]